MSDDEQTTATLMHLAGPRLEVPADRAVRVKDAVRVNWRAGVGRRRVRRGVWVASTLVATAAAIVLVVRPSRDAQPAVVPGEVLATVERVEGPGATATLRPGAAIHVNDWIETGANTRAALRLTGATSVRLDRESRVRIVAPTAMELAVGAVYVDTGRESSGLDIRTALGTAHDIGTQFEVRMEEATLHIRVRSGIVELRGKGRPVEARAGTALTISGAGAVSEAIDAHGAAWRWVADLAPPFEIEGRTVGAFLDHMSRENGWTLRYADAALTRDVSAIILHGSVAGLPAGDALSVALSASGLGHRLDRGDLIVFREKEAR